MKLNLVIDASGIFYRSLFTIGSFDNVKSEKLLETTRSQGIFIRKLAADFSALVKAIDEPARVIVCLDSTSWRKSIDIVDGGYKSERKKDETAVNWKAFYDLVDKFSNILSQKGYLVSKTPGAEADDLLFFWSRKLNNLGENVVLITGDRDLLQTVGKHTNGSWTIALDPILNRKKISLTAELLDFKEKSVEHDIFNPDSWSTSDDILEKLTSSYDLNVVDPKKLALMKVVLGDGGDSVPSVITWMDKKYPDKPRTMTESNYSKILEAAPEMRNASWRDLRKGMFVEEISSTMEKLKKIEVDRELVKKNIERNCQLVILSTETIPEQIVNIFKSMHGEAPPDLIPVTGRDALLAGSEWWTSDKTEYVPKSYDLFS